MSAHFSSMEIGFGGAKRPFFYRKNSTDEQVIKEVLIDQQYDLNRLVRSPELIGFIRRCRRPARRGR